MISHISLDSCLKFVQILALVLGGIGAYYRWFKGRIYKGRLETNVSGTATRKSDGIYIDALVSIKNIGSTRLDIHKDGAWLCLSYFEILSKIRLVSSDAWEYMGRFPVFANNQFIESGETVQDNLLILVPEGEIGAFQIEFSINAGETNWQVKSVVNIEEKVKLPHRRITV